MKKHILQQSHKLQYRLSALAMSHIASTALLITVIKHTRRIQHARKIAQYKQIMADLTMHMLQEAALGLLLWPPGQEDAAAAAGKLPDPMYPGESP